MTSAPTMGSQAMVLEAFTVLQTLRSGWQGSLILNVSLEAKGAALSLASSVARAVCLTLEPDAAVLRAAMRLGACDFLVNTLDEALRAIKNEIRQGKPLAVGLHGDPTRLLDEIAERGVAPRLFTAAERFPEHARALADFGAELMSLDPNVQGVLTVDEVLRGAALPWRLETFSFPDNASVREFDARALHSLAAADALRRQWLLSAARLFPRERSRTLWLNGVEAAELRSAEHALRDA